MFYPYYILSFIYYCSHHASRSSAAWWFAHGIISLCLLYLFLSGELGGCLRYNFASLIISVFCPTCFVVCARYNFASLIISVFIWWAGWFAYHIILLCLLYLILSDVLSPWNGVPWAVRAVALSKMMNMTALVQAHRCHVYHFWHVSLPTLIISPPPLYHNTKLHYTNY